VRSFIVGSKEFSLIGYEIEKDEVKAKEKMLDMFSDYHPDIVDALRYIIRLALPHDLSN
jgi:hypothetical protein